MARLRNRILWMAARIWVSVLLLWLSTKLATLALRCADVLPDSPEEPASVPAPTPQPEAVRIVPNPQRYQPSAFEHGIASLVAAHDMPIEIVDGQAYAAPQKRGEC